MHKQQIRRRRATALVLVGISIFLLTVYFNEATSGALHSVQRGAMEVFSPLQSGASSAIKPGRDLVNWVGDSFDAKSQNKQLRGDLLDARLRVAQLATAESENEQLRKLLNFGSSGRFPSGVSPVGARVIVRSPTDWFGTVNINKGTTSGVRLDQAVISGDGLVGRVTSVSAHAAQVTLLTDSSSGVAAMVVGRRVLGVVLSRAGGEAGADDLLLAFIRQRGSVREGDMVVTTGTVADPGRVRSAFPSGIPIGSVKQVDQEDRALYQRVHIRPYANVRDLQLVQVLVKTR